MATDLIPRVFRETLSESLKNWRVADARRGVGYVTPRVYVHIAFKQIRLMTISCFVITRPGVLQPITAEDLHPDLELAGRFERSSFKLLWQ